jgi:hypothetical protein
VDTNQAATLTMLEADTSHYRTVTVWASGQVSQ